jgi:ABC-type lipoprotein export system ATPase subunit
VNTSDEPGQVLVATDMHRSFDDGRVQPLRGANLEIRAGTVVAITGPSGSGKSTLLNLLGLLDRPDQGSINLMQNEVTLASRRERRKLRAEHLGFVFQDALMDPRRTAAENLWLALDASGAPRALRAARIDRCLETVGLAHRRDALASTMSGGERQRLAVARAIIHGPSLLLCDEPTGNLDRENTEVVYRTIRGQVGERRAAVVVTHDLGLAALADAHAELRDGKLVVLR